MESVADWVETSLETAYEQTSVAEFVAQATGAVREAQVQQLMAQTCWQHKLG